MVFELGWIFKLGCGFAVRYVARVVEGEMGLAARVRYVGER